MRLKSRGVEGLKREMRLAVRAGEPSEPDAGNDVGRRGAESHGSIRCDSLRVLPAYQPSLDSVNAAENAGDLGRPVRAMFR